MRKQALEAQLSFVHVISTPSRGRTVRGMEPHQFLHETTSGPGDPVVLVPGGLTGWNSWLPVVDTLSNDRTVVRVQPTQNELGGMNGIVGDPTYDTDVELAGLLLAMDELELD